MGSGSESSSEDNSAGRRQSEACDTIYALSTGAGRAGVAVVRVSGPRAMEAAARLSARPRAPREARLVTFRDPETGAAIDRGLVLAFAGPASATGEDVAELHVHGGRAVVASMLRALGALPGLRLAEPGEFTRRAFENGKIDLTEAEGLADLLAAETEAQRRQALSGMRGALREAAEGWRDRLMRMLALCEAELDFPDEEDVPDEAGRAGLAGIGAVLAEIVAALHACGRGERLREGFQVVIAGPPNAGKSTLLNALAGRDVAIVSEEAGTTRDLIEVHLDLGGYPVMLVDTAGLREAEGAVEREGMRRARARIDMADVVLVLAAADETDVGPGVAGAARVLNVQTKIDLAAGGRACRPGLAVSARTGEGLAALLDALRRAAESALQGEPALVTRERQRTALAACAEALVRVEQGRIDRPLELVAEDLRQALRALGRLTGRVDVEQLLDIVFSEFCLGK